MIKDEICETNLSGLYCTRSRKQSEGSHLQQSFFFLVGKVQEKKEFAKMRHVMSVRIPRRVDSMYICLSLRDSTDIYLPSTPLRVCYNPVV